MHGSFLCATEIYKEHLDGWCYFEHDMFLTLQGGKS